MIAVQTANASRWTPPLSAMALDIRYDFRQRNFIMGSQKNRSLFTSLSHAALVNATLAALLLASAASAQSPPQTTVSRTVTFSASNQNYWPGAAGSLQPVQLFPTQADGTNTITFTPPLPFSNVY